MATARPVSDVVMGSKLRGLRPLLETWVKLLEEYCEANGWGDNPWWYNERANLGLLAGAAWRAGNGWHALEEFPTTKRFTARGKLKHLNPAVPKKGVEKGKLVRGRCDLYVSHARTAFAVEAKQAWQNLAPRASVDRLGPAMTLAKRDAGNLRAGEADLRVGAVFVVPFVPTKLLRPKGSKKGEIDAEKGAAMFQEWLGCLKKDKDSAYAYFHTTRSKEFVNAKWNRLFPGVALVLRRCKTGTRTRRK